MTPPKSRRSFGMVLLVAAAILVVLGAVVQVRTGSGGATLIAVGCADLVIGLVLLKKKGDA